MSARMSPADLIDRAIADRGAAVKALAAATEDDKPDHHRNAPMPDDECLYGLVGEIARAGGDGTEANPFAIALNALAYLGCCVGRGPYMPVGNTYHHARLFTMHVGRSGIGRKGDAVSLIHRVDMSLRKASEFLAPQVHRGGLSSREGLAFLIHDGFKEGRNEVEPIHDKRLWVLESEFANVLHQTKRDGNTLSAALRDLFDGVGIKPATKANRISASNPHVGLSAAVTPGELLSLIEARELSNGFANRFLTIYSERSRLVPFPQATPQEVVDRLAGRIAGVIRFADAVQHKERDHLRMSLAPPAARRYEALYRGELDRRDYGTLIDGLLERRAPVLLRIAMLFALTDLTTVVETVHIDAALAWIRYWVESVRFIFSSAAQEVAQGEIAGIAEKIVEFLRVKGRTTRLDLRRDCFQGHEPKERLDAALDDLLSATPPRITVELVARPKGSPGSPTRFYELPAQSAHCAQREDSCGLAGDLQGAQSVRSLRTVGVDAADEPPGCATVRTVRKEPYQPATRANAHSAQSAHSAQGEVEVGDESDDESGEV